MRKLVASWFVLVACCLGCSVSSQHEAGAPVLMRWSLQGEPEEGVAPQESAGLRGAYVPLLYVNSDIDEDEPGGGVELAADLDEGTGYSVGVEMGNQTHSFTLDYVRTRHREKVGGGHAVLHHLVARGWFGGTLFGTETVDLGLRAGAGIGGVLIDFNEHRFDDAGGASAIMSGELQVLLFQRVRMTLGLHGFLWGYPGETIAHGGFVTLGGSVRF